MSAYIYTRRKKQRESELAVVCVNCVVLNEGTTLRKFLLFRSKVVSPPGGYSVSLQASIYDTACLALTALPVVSTIKIDTPNKHYLPAKLLDNLGDRTGEEVLVWEDDVFIPTDEPSGTITCTVGR